MSAVGGMTMSNVRRTYSDAFLCKWSAAIGRLEMPHCSRCGNLPAKRCSRCRLARYCSADCQRAHWIGHKPHCRSYGLPTKPTEPTKPTPPASPPEPTAATSSPPPMSTAALPLVSTGTLPDTTPSPGPPSVAPAPGKEEKKEEKTELMIVRPWDGGWPWAAGWVPDDDGAFEHAVTLDYDDTATVVNNWRLLHSEDATTKRMAAWDEPSRNAVANYHLGGTSPSALCAAKDLFLHIFGGPERVAMMLDTMDWLRSRNVRLRICSRRAVDDIMGGLAAVGIDPRRFYEIHGKRKYDEGPWVYWSRSDGLLHDLPVEVDMQERAHDLSSKVAPLTHIFAHDNVPAKHDNVPAKHDGGPARRDGAPAKRGASVFVDDCSDNCADAECLGFLTIHVPGMGMERAQVDELKEIVAFGDLTPGIRDARRMKKEADELAAKERDARSKEAAKEYDIKNRAAEEKRAVEAEEYRRMHLANSLAEVQTAMAARKLERELELKLKLERDRAATVSAVAGGTPGPVPFHVPQ